MLFQPPYQFRAGYMQKTNFRDQFTNVADACALAQSIVDTVREPVVVLDKGLRVIAASRSFYSAFKVSPEETQGKLLYALGDGQWDIPRLRVLLEKIIPEHGVMEDYEVEHEFPHLGHRTMCLNARQAFYEGGAETTILLGIEDVTGPRMLERQKDELLKQKDILFDEIQHRISNSLQIIAGIILMKANTVSSEESRVLLRDTHDRVISIATVQQQLNASGTIGPIEMVPYLTRLGNALAASMIGDARPVTLKVVGTAGSLSSRQAESIGLIATELVMNALKHAFPAKICAAGSTSPTMSMARIGNSRLLTMELASRTVSLPKQRPGLGTGIIKALAQELNAKVETLAGPDGTIVSITHATFAATVTRAA
jgi:two-component sensor histidine kinase